MPVSLTSKTGDLATFAIKSAGSPISDSIEIIAITIKKRLNMPDEAQIIVLDGSAETGTFEISSSNIFVPGVEVIIEAGYNAQNNSLFKGNVTVQNIRINDNVGSTLTIDCHSTSIESWTINSNPVITVQYGVDILEFNAEYSRSTTTGIAKVHGVVTFQGSALAKPGEYISLAGLGSRFNGNHLISAVVHRIEGGNWITEVAFGLAD